jgi:hypothetical protein
VSHPRRGRLTQDTCASSQEVAVQSRPHGSIPRSLHVEPVPPSVVQDLIETHHYLRSMPASPRLCFGVYLLDRLVGAVVFTAGSRLGHKLLAAAKPQDVVTLARLYLTDDMPKNSESRVLSVVLRYIKRHTDWKLILSYSDPAAGHVGTVYQASGWMYLGQTEPGGYVDLGDGRLHHPRSVYTQYGSNNVRHLRATGVPARRVPVPGKHRYVYVLDPLWAWRLRHRARPYPKAGARDPPEGRDLPIYTDQHKSGPSEVRSRSGLAKGSTFMATVTRPLPSPPFEKGE